MKRCLLAVLLGMLFTFFTIECGLRIVYKTYERQRKVVPVVSQKKYPLTILCLGDSFTEGSGAPVGKSYPDYLQSLFDHSRGSDTVRVIKRGVPAMNSSELLFQLDRFFDGQAIPDWVVLQVGGANFFNRRGFSDYWARRKTGSLLSAMGFAMQDALYHSKTFKLLVYLYRDIQQRRHSEAYKDKDLQKIYVWVGDEFRRRYTEKKEPAGVNALRQEDIEDARRLFLRMIQRDPKDQKNYYVLGCLCCFQERYEESLAWFVKGIRVNPGYRDRFTINRNYQGVKMLMRRAKDDRLQQEIRSFIEDFGKTHPKDIVNLYNYPFQDLMAWIDSDLGEIIRLLRSKNMGVIIQNYPPSLSYWKSGAKEDRLLLNDFLRKKAAAMRIPFVDNEQKFREAYTTAREEQYSIPDGHCNEKGYQYMARNVFSVLERELHEN